MKILFFAPIAYRDLKQRPQYLAEGLAREHEVIYVDPTVSAMKYLLKGGERPGGYLYPAGKNLTVLRLNGALSAHRSLEVFGNWIALRTSSAEKISAGCRRDMDRILRVVFPSKRISRHCDLR